MRTIGLVWPCLLLAVISAFAGDGERCTISGYITDAADGEAIAGANVYLKGESYGAAANIHGFYTIPIVPKGGPYTLIVSAIGYKSIEKQIVCEGEPLRLDFELTEEAIRAEEVVIEAKRVGGMQDPYVGHTIVESHMLRTTPALVEPDLFRSLQLLPGVQSISDYSSGLYIWGDNPSANLVLLDNIEVYNPTHLFGFFSTFIVDAVREANLIKGGYPAKWGGRIGSVLDVTNKDGNRKKFEGMAELSLLSGMLLLEGPVAKGSYMVAGRRTWFDQATLMMLGEEDYLPYYFYDIQGRINQDLSDRDKVTFSFYAGDDVFVIESDDEWADEDDDFEYRWGNLTLSLQWKHIFNERLFGHMVLAGSRFRARFNTGDGYYTRTNNLGDISFKGDISYFKSDKHTLTFGGMLKWREVQNYDKISETEFEDDTLSTTTEYVIWDLYKNASLIALYGEEEYRPNALWRFQAGLRTEYAFNGGYFRIGPRLSAQRKIDELTTLRAAIGRYYQYVYLYNPAEDFGFAVLDFWLPIDSTVKPATADHFVIGIDTDHLPFRVSANAYYKRMYHLLAPREQFILIVDDNIHSQFYEGDGWAGGFDVTLEGKAGRFGGWLGYGLGWTMRTDGRNNGEPYYPKYDRRHSLELSLAYRPHPRLNLNVAFNYSTGQPYTEPTDWIYDSEEDVYKPVFEEDVYHNGRLPDYRRLDLGMYWTLHEGNWRMLMFLQILNVFNSDNVLSRDWDHYSNSPEGSYDDMNMLPFLPTFGFRAEF